MRINDHEFSEDLLTIIMELHRQVQAKGLPYINKIIDGPDNVQICCPYHKDGLERKPSAGIKKSDGTFHCFACEETHTLPELVSYCLGHYDDVIGGYGWNWLLKNFLTVEIGERKDVKLDFGRNSSKIGNNSNANPVYISEKELDKYRYYHKYWEKRGITDEYIIELFDLGYDKKTKSITFPVRDIEGHCLFVARRNVHTKFFNYPAGVKKPLYGLYELNSVVRFKEDDIIVCESMIDCILLWQEGHFAVALNGLGNELQMKQLQDLPCRKLILCTDNDEAGDSARDRIKKFVKGKIFTEIIFPDKIKDVGECSKEQIKNILKWEEYV